ncbi:PEP-CTERM sorting domain-containing protein [Phycisphaera mikurensis]|uniref:Ice-binding protein C-terminal domain-containing protein n=1 Tax=Phycisphaera mikurensis (strain NBRC 102666 / KCTC 22515 / FYK2301M01) TaxID=1142394 RepID=I0IBL0_PHYMF|nr:PEP-CTERM sorting domain-containing protein [Phycisphaera mikurensis]MBB6442823.1 hypothetical protein [Phycisphaera mikurensis]BAM02648.1 hypothetical protein PSMK_04890 [Phycisphaera mikurensis NBRC 102666]
MRSLPSLALLATGAFVSAFAAQSVRAQTVLYSDSFDSRLTGSGVANGNPAGDGNGSSDWGTADNALGGSAVVAWSAGRNGGPTGGAQFTTNAGATVTPGPAPLVGTMFNGAVNTDTSVTADAALGLNIAFDFSRDGSAPIDGVDAPGNGFLSVGTGYDETVNAFSPFETTGNSDFAVLFQQAANGNTGNAEIFSDGTSLGTFDYGDPLATHSVELDFVPVVAGAYGAADAIAYAVIVDGNALASGTITGGAEFGDLAFATNLFSAANIDNLVVSGTPIPEPATAALLALGGAALLGRRRRG